jgi:hypothetical protein
MQSPLQHHFISHLKKCMFMENLRYTYFSISSKLHKFVAILMLLLCIGEQNLFAQRSKSKLAVAYLDAKGITLDPMQLSNLARMEIEKTGLYEVLDRYDVAYLVEKDNLKLENCYGKTCLVELGKKLKSDKILTGSVELFGEKIVVSVRILDVATETIEKSKVTEFLNLKSQLQAMIGVTICQMFDLPIDQNLLTKLSKSDDYESAVNVPEATRLNLSGPRMGVTLFTGKAAADFNRPTNQGGLNAAPVMFQFGYQFETTYLNQGGLQALFEFIPIITGLDQGHFIPSISFLHGLRSNRNGFEFAFGPALYLTKTAQGLFIDNKWTLLTDWQTNHPNEPSPESVETRFDKRGDVTATTAFVFAFGKSFKSGKMNIPLNAYFIPSRTGMRFGVSFGFNGRGG